MLINSRQSWIKKRIQPKIKSTAQRADGHSMRQGLTIRFAQKKDIGQILKFIYALSDYEKMRHEVVATEESLEEWIFQKKKAEVLIAEYDHEPVGFALFFHNFSTFLGRAGIYLEDLYVYPGYRGRGYGKQLLKHLAGITVERECGRLEWCCLDWNTPSIEFYKSMQAVPMDEWTTYRMTGDVLEEFVKGN